MHQSCASTASQILQSVASLVLTVRRYATGLRTSSHRQARILSAEEYARMLSTHAVTLALKTRCTTGTAQAGSGARVSGPAAAPCAGSARVAPCGRQTHTHTHTQMFLFAWDTQCMRAVCHHCHSSKQQNRGLTHTCVAEAVGACGTCADNLRSAGSCH